MATKRTIKYYLLNGKAGVGNALDLEIDGKLKRDFADISTLDLLTMDIPYQKAEDVLKEYNPETDLSGIFYDAQYPYKKVETKTFAPVFNIEDENCKYFMDNLKYFAEQRNYKVEKGKSVALDNNSFLKNYTKTLLYYILRNNNRKVIRNDSLVAKSLKEELEEAFRQISSKSIDNYFNTKSGHKLFSLLDHYTQIRNLTLEYISSISDIKVPNRRTISNASRFENYGMEERESAILPKEKKSDKQVKYYQMTLADFNPNKQ